LGRVGSVTTSLYRIRRQIQQQKQTPTGLLTSWQLISSVQSNARFHFVNQKRHLIHPETDLARIVLLQEKLFFLQLQFAPQADPADQPYFDLVVQRQTEPPGQFNERRLALNLPASIALARIPGVKIEFVLRIHRQTDLAPIKSHRPAGSLSPKINTTVAFSGLMATLTGFELNFNRRSAGQQDSDSPAATLAS
jgi:hypothetical protein